MANVVSELILRARDEISKEAEKAARSLGHIGQAAGALGRQSSAVGRFGASLNEMNAALGKVANLQKMQTRLNELGASYDKAKVRVRELGTALNASENPTQRMIASYEKAVKALNSARDAMSSQKWEIDQQSAGLSKMGVAVGELASAENRLKTSITETTEAMRRQMETEAGAAARSRHRTSAIRGVAGAASGIAGMYVLEGTEKGIEAGARQGSSINKLAQAGISPGDIARIVAEAMALHKVTPSLSPAELIDLHKEVRSAVQKPEEAFEIMPELAKATAILKSLGAENANIADLVKGAESLGMMGDVTRFHQYLSGQIKAMSVMGHTITTEQTYEAAKYSKSAGATLSDEFINTTLPSLIQEMHGSSAGDALSMLTKTLRGGLQHRHLAAKRLGDLGLLEDPSKIIKNKTGEIIGYSGKVKGDDTLAADPRKWFQEIFKPAAEAHGIKTLSDQVLLLNQTLPSTAANLGRIMLQQEETLKAHAANYAAAPDIDQMQKNMANDPVAGFNALRGAIEGFSAAVTGPMLEGIAPKLMSFAQGIAAVSESVGAFFKENPTLGKLAGGAAAAGGLAGGTIAAYGMWEGLTSGFGLKGSALALDESAAALTRAAGLLGAEGGLGDLAGGAAGKGGRWGFLTKFMKRVPFAAAAGILADSIPHPDWMDKSPGELLSMVPSMRLKDVRKTLAPTTGYSVNTIRRGPAAAFAPPTGGAYMGSESLAQIAGKYPGTAMPGGSSAGWTPPATGGMGQSAGQQFAAGIERGLMAASAAVISQAESIFSRIRSIFAAGINVPMRVQQTGAVAPPSQSSRVAMNISPTYHFHGGDKAAVAQAHRSLVDHIDEAMNGSFSDFQTGVG